MEVGVALRTCVNTSKCTQQDAIAPENRTYLRDEALAASLRLFEVLVLAFGVAPGVETALEGESLVMLMSK